MNRNRATVGCGLGIVLLFGAGCAPTVSRSPDAESAAKSPRKGAHSRTSAGGASQAGGGRANVAPDAFASIEQAVGALTAAAEARDSGKRLEASDWLALQGAAAIPRLRAVLDDPQAGTAPRIAACRVLGRLGPPALEPLLGQLNSDDQMVRINALDQLPHLEPCPPQAIETLIKTLDHDDDRMRQRAMKGLARLGPKARAAAPRLQEILNSQDDHQLRDNAKQALQSVDPRRTLTFD